MHLAPRYGGGVASVGAWPSESRGPAQPRLAATVVLLREERGRLEALLVRRGADLRYLGGAWVFPGGALDEADCAEEILAGIPHDVRERCRRRLAGSGEPPGAAAALGLFVAACRETFEECGVVLARRADGSAYVPDGRPAARERRTFAQLLFEERLRPDVERLVLWGHWLTPAAAAIRFDTRFFALRMPPGQTAAADEAEITDAAWVGPAAPDPAYAIPPPTRLMLADVANAWERHGSLQAMLAAEAGRPVPRVLPKLVEREEGRVTLFPWDPEYAAAPGEGSEPAEVPPHLARLPSRVVLTESLRYPGVRPPGPAPAA